jgi:hypothetical protein
MPETVGQGRFDSAPRLVAQHDQISEIPATLKEANSHGECSGTASTLLPRAPYRKRFQSDLPSKGV